MQFRSNGEAKYFAVPVTNYHFVPKYSQCCFILWFYFVGREPSKPLLGPPGSILGRRFAQEPKLPSVPAGGKQGAQVASPLTLATHAREPISLAWAAEVKGNATCTFSCPNPAERKMVLSY